MGPAGPRASFIHRTSDGVIQKAVTPPPPQLSSVRAVTVKNLLVYCSCGIYVSAFLFFPTGKIHILGIPRDQDRAGAEIMS